MNSNSDNPNDRESEEEVNVPSCSLCHAMVPWEEPLPSSPENDLRWYRITSRSQPCPFWLRQKLTLFWLEPGQDAYLLTKGRYFCRKPIDQCWLKAQTIQKTMYRCPTDLEKIFKEHESDQKLWKLKRLEA